MRIEDSSDDETPTPTHDRLASASGLPHRWIPKPLSVKMFIDDISAFEKVALQCGVRQISQSKEEVFIHAGQCQSFFDQVSSNAMAIGMVVNPDKTQLLCVTTAINYQVRSFIYAAGKRVVSGHRLKLLGYNFGRRITPTEHVKALRQKYGARSWVIRHLKQAHIKADTLVRVYSSLIRPAIKYPSSVYHSLLSAENSESIERLQRMALKNVYGIRREESLLAFEKREESSEKFCDHWFKKKEPSTYALRRENKFVEEFALRDRLRNAPIYTMRKILNAASS